MWVSEVMLQQTQVKTVEPRFRDWCERFPTLEALAAAKPDEVLKAWEGLGYYRRARHLMEAARIIIERHQGRFPETFEDILALPGIGRSTAGAISSICFGTHKPVLDGNVKRVLRRWHGDPNPDEGQLWEWAEQAIAMALDPGTWNQAMMELGATVCHPRNPKCNACPVSSDCQSAFQHLEHKSSKGKKTVDLHWRVLLYVDEALGVWMERRPKQGIWAGLWSLPIVPLTTPPPDKPCHIHTLSHRRLHLYTKRMQGPPSGIGRWVSQADAYAIPTGIRRLLAKKNLL